MKQAVIPLGQLFIWEEPGSPDIKIGNRAAAEASARFFDVSHEDALPPYQRLASARPAIESWEFDEVVACGAASSPVRLRISGQSDDLAAIRLLSPLVTDKRPAAATLDLVIALDGTVSLWQGDDRIEDVSGDSARPANPAADMLFVLPHLWFGDRVCGILHACAMQWQGKTFALLGQSGSGKSTLAAHLAARGARYVSDDQLILLDDGTVPRLMVPPSIKIGAWDLVSRDFPALKDMPTFLKIETPYRLLPDAPFSQKDTALSPQHFFFVGFSARRSLSLDRIELDEAFLRLSSIGFWVRNGRLADVAGHLRSSDWHWLRHGDSTAATEAIAEVLAQ